MMIALVTIASRIVGFVRWLVQASEVGPNALGDAYTAANTLPNVLFEVAAGGALAGAVVPLLAVPLARSLRQDVDRTASALLGWALVVLLPLAVVVALLARPLIGVFMSGLEPQEVDVAARFLAVFAPQIPLYGVGVVLTGVLQAQRRFLAASLAPLLNSLVVIAVYLVFGRLVPDSSLKDDPSAIADSAIALLGWGTTAGVAVMSLSLLWPVHRTGVRLRPTLRFPTGVARRARSLALAGLGALVAQQIAVVVTLALAIEHGERGTFTVFLYTQAVYFLPYAVLAFPLATATLPRLAERAARADRAGFAQLAAGTTRAVLVVSGLGAATLVAVAPAVQDVFGHIADGDVTGMATALTWIAPGLLGFALILQLSRALYALDRGRAAGTATAAGWLTVAVVALVLVPVFSSGRDDQVATLHALAVATSVGMTVAGAGLVLSLVRAAGREAVTGLPRTVVVLVAAGAVAALVGRQVVLAIGSAGWSGALLSGVVGAVACAVVVLAATWLADRSSVRALMRVRPRGDDTRAAGRSVSGPPVG